MNNAARGNRSRARRPFMRHFAKTRLAAQARKKTSAFSYALYWLGSFSFCLWLAWVMLSESDRGWIGRPIAGALIDLLGFTAYLFPFIFLYGLAAILVKLNKPHKGVLTLTGGILLTLGSVSAFIGMLSSRFGPEHFKGGWLGDFLWRELSIIFGGVGAGLFSAVLLFAGVQLLFNISWRRVFKMVSSAVISDYRNWAAARRELSAKLKIISEKEGTGGPAYDAKPIPEPPPVIRAGAQPESGPAAESPGRPQVVRAKSPAAGDKPETTQSAGGKEARARQEKKTAADVQKLTDPYFKNFQLPGIDLLDPPAQQGAVGPSDDEINSARLQLETTLKSFNVAVTVSGVYPGPVVTRYEVAPAPGVKISSIVSLCSDVALAMKSAGAIRVIAPIPGKSAIGFEIPNNKRAKVYLRELLQDPAFNGARAPLTFALGRYAEGAVAVANLEGMPHLLVAGATASGKSVFMQSLILSLIFRNKPDEVKFLFIDPKRLELTFYEDIPYLYDPKEAPDRVSVITSPKDAAKSLVALTRVMEKRYKKFEQARVKNIASYNKWALQNGQPQEYYIVVVIDELADLMLQQKNVVEDAIQRLAQMARAVGIHLVLATQRPSVDVITGVIKANLPSRIALQVTSKTDSRVILDTPGAEALIGKGDLLYLAIDAQKPSRIQGAFVSEDEIRKVVDFVKAQARPNYLPLSEDEETQGSGKGSSSVEMMAALRLVQERKRVSQDLLKAHFGSSSRATNILSLLEMSGFIHKPEGSNRWEIFFDRIEEHIKKSHNAAPQQAPAEEPVGEEFSRNE
ncbi:MAG: cell division protein FtsK [Elusimicrobia bacterium CG08_land_8_20_14_0_20_59_10]|nr:MAG: cell division protein FtsK [Elusimicrobia bacterium CG08_land_8_20_14_0_20_59_10]